MASSKMVHKWRSDVMTAVNKNDFNQLNDLMKTTCKQSGAEVDVNFINYWGWSPLMKAVESNNINVFRLLVSHGANMHADPGYHSEITELYATADHKLEALVLDQGAQSAHKYASTLLLGSPIGAAIYLDNAVIVKHILEHCDAPLNRLPLGLLFHWAIATHSQRSAIMLLRHGYYPIQKPSQRYTSCFQAAVFNNQVTLALALVLANPQFIQEQWTREEQFSAPPERSRLIAKLIACGKQRQSLQKLCKCTILAQLGPHYRFKIHDLPLPTALKNFLKAVELPTTDELPHNAGGDMQ